MLYSLVWGDIFGLTFQFLGLYARKVFFFSALLRHSITVFLINSLNLYGSLPVFNKIKSCE